MALTGDRAMQMNGLNVCITVAKYATPTTPVSSSGRSKEWSKPDPARETLNPISIRLISGFLADQRIERGGNPSRKIIIC